jgi:nitroreductase
MQQGQRERAPSVRTAPHPDDPVRGPVLTFDVWDRMAPAAAASRPPGQTVIAPALATALNLIDLGFTRTRGGPAGCYAVPSAGAVHPYEFFVIIAEEGRPAVFYTDPLRRRVTRLRAPDSAGALLDSAGLSMPSPSGALIVIVARPWLSIRKYGDRGYIYTQLDLAHVAVNLLGVAAERFAAGLRLRFGHSALAELLTVADDCREPHSVLCIEPARPAAAARTVPTEPPPPDGNVTGQPPTGQAPWLTGRARPEQPSWLERLCWESLHALALGDTYDETTGSRPPGRHQHTAADSYRSVDGAPEPVQRWSELSYLRRSSKGFQAGAVPVEDLARILSTARMPLAVDSVDLLDTAGLNITLVARSISGLTPGSYRISGLPGTAAFEPAPTASAVRYTPGAAATTAGGTDDEIVRACMQQEHLGTCAAAVLFHAERDKFVGHPSAAMRGLLFRAGGLAQLYYLGARSRSVGVTAVGGFDSGRWRALAGLDGHQELLYLLLLGVDGGPGVKWDRLQTAHTQGEK